jgi:hypothetical protein
MKRGPDTSGQVEVKEFSQSEPSGYALAAIASVFEQSNLEAALVEGKPDTSEEGSVKILSPGEPSDYAMAVITSLPDHPGSHPEPTDLTLATIASILDHPASPSEVTKAPAEKLNPWLELRLTAQESAPVPSKPYASNGPSRRGDDQYIVDQTIGQNSRPISSGPMSADAAIRFVDDHAREARLRFEALRNEMARRAAGS